MECARGPTPSRFAAAAAALGKQNYGPQKYPQWLRALKGLKSRHDKLVESSSLYRQSLLIGKRVSNTSSKLASLSGAFIAGIVSPRPRKKKTLERAEPTGESKTEFSKTNQQVGDTISATVLATDICHDAHLAHAHAAAASPKSQEERDFQEYIESARIALDEDFQKPLTADDMKKIYRAEANAAQEVLAMQEDISVMKAAELLGDEEALMTADYYGADLPPPRMDDTASCDDSEREPVVKRVKSASSDARADQDIAKRGTVLLYPAGRILHFVYKSGLDEAVDEARRESRHALFFDVDLDVYRKIILSRTMIADHFLSQYEDVLDSFVRECARA
jgi:hypothetical protein